MEKYHPILAASTFADVILPLAVPKPYTYAVPEELLAQVQFGVRAEVEFGSKKLYAGVVMKVHQNKPSHPVKSILSVIDTGPVINEIQLKFWLWLADYYCCSLGEIMDAALPANLKLASERRIVLSPLYDGNMAGLDDREFLIAEALSIQDTLTIDDVRKILNQKTVFNIIRQMMEKKVIYLYEEMQEKYAPKKVACVRLAGLYRSNPKMLEEAFELCSRAARQTEALLAFAQISKEQGTPLEGSGGVLRQAIYKKAGVDSTVLNAMEKKGIFELFEREVSRIGGYEEELSQADELTEQQIKALHEIRSYFTGPEGVNPEGGNPVGESPKGVNKNVVLLHGVTGSGKTRVYVELIREAMARGEQVLYLLPEVALTTQIISRLQKVLGDQVTVYHHRITNNERVEVWQMVLQSSVRSSQSAVFSPQSAGEQAGLQEVTNEPSPATGLRTEDCGLKTTGEQAGLQEATNEPSPATGLRTEDCGLKTAGEQAGLQEATNEPSPATGLQTEDCGLKTANCLLGARSALFLPFSKLGLVIVDEEHDSSFKQQDPAPRYHGRDAAIYLAHLHGAKVVLGTATPAIESYYNAKSGKYGLVEMNDRYGGVEMPEIVIVDAKEEAKQRKMQSHFTSVLLEELKAALERGEQAILFQNRRGYAPTLRCITCGWHSECIHCDVSLTYHKHRHHLQCHYCGYHIPLAAACPACGSNDLKLQGFGTEKIEDELKIYLPEAHIGRMDYDAVRTKDAHARIINDFEERRLDLLVGTQMVTKGLDFENVGIVGVLSADQLLQFPDFRSSERGFQLITQVAGRSGRKGGKRGKVIVQAMNVTHPVLREVLDNDFQAFYNREIMERKSFHYPPFGRLIKITLKHKKPDVLNRSTKIFADVLRKKLGDRVLGPTVPAPGRVRGQFLLDILIKMEMKPAVWKASKEIIQEATQVMQQAEGFSTVRVNVDVDPV